MMAACVDCIDTWTLVGGFHGGLGVAHVKDLDTPLEWKGTVVTSS
jgi:hypothetical protein